jgi:hypothetical protein
MKRRNERHEANTEHEAKHDQTEFLLRCQKCGNSRMKMIGGGEVDYQEVRFICASKTMDHEVQEMGGYQEIAIEFECASCKHRLENKSDFEGLETWLKQYCDL